LEAVPSQGGQVNAVAYHLLRSPHRKLNAKTIGEAVLWLSFSMHVKE
jgi:hypothetical protein